MKHTPLRGLDAPSAPAWVAGLFALLAICQLSAPLSAQEAAAAEPAARAADRAARRAVADAPFLVSTADGRQLAASRLATQQTGDATALEWFAPGAGTRARRMPWTEVIGIHGAAPDGDATPHAIRLVDGGQLRGRVVGGDDYGDLVALESPAFGTLQVPLDSIRAIGFDGAPMPAWEATEDGDDVLYVAARLGADSIVGAIHRMDQAGVWFARDGQEEPAHYPFRRVLGLGIAGSPPPERRPEALLLTRYGDRVELTGLSLGDGKVRGESLLRAGLATGLSQMAALTPLGRDRTHLSDLGPVEVVERSYEDPEHPLYPHRMDRNILGDPLVAQGRCHGKGVGVHAASRIAWQIPAGRSRFLTWVSIDDSALALMPRASVQVQVLVDGKAIGEPRELSAGDAPIGLGVIQVAAGQRLTLQVDFGAGLDLADRVVWLHPVLLP